MLPPFLISNLVALALPFLLEIHLNLLTALSHFAELRLARRLIDYYSHFIVVGSLS